MERAWVLIGMMGAGKSAVGRALAATTGREFLDTDQMLQHRLGRSIRQIFHIYGESAFRDHETALLRSLQPGPFVLSTGGGIVIRPENWNELRRLGTIVYLKASLETLQDRLEHSKKKRPLLEGEDWKEKVEAILAARTHLYEQADIVISLDANEIDEAAQQVLAKLEGA